MNLDIYKWIRSEEASNQLWNALGKSCIKSVLNAIFNLICGGRDLILLIVDDCNTYNTFMFKIFFIPTRLKTLLKRSKTRYLCCITKCHVMICNFIALRSQNKLFDLICSCLQKHPRVSCTYSKLLHKILYYNFEGHVQQQLFHMIVINLG